MDKFIILTTQDMVDWGLANLPINKIRCIGSDGSGVFIFDTVPSRFSSKTVYDKSEFCLLYTSPSPRDVEESRMPSSA